MGKGTTGQQTVINLTAHHKQFNMKTMTVPAGAQVVINFHNMDFLTPHNFALYTDSTAKQTIFKGEVILVKKEIVYKFTAPSQPGTYFFRCDVHPTMMFGDFIVQ